MWKPDEHTDDENLRWASLRAVEWREWPLFILQPIIPVLLYYYPWQWVIAAIVVAVFLWWLIVAPRITPATGIDVAVYFVWLKLLTSPLMAYWTWQNGGQWMAVVVLISPFLTTWIVGLLLMIPQEILSFIFPVLKASQVGLVQQRFMDRFGYERVEGLGYMRRGAD